MAPVRSGLNHGAYFGERIEISEVLRSILAAAHAHGWSIETLEASPGIRLPVLTRVPQPGSAWNPRIYLSAGIHGDEPAGPLAVLDLLRADRLPTRAWLWCCPCLNPTGFPRNTRESSAGVDLNRDYRHRESPEIRAHAAWLERQPMFDLALCLHEDWEAAGFYVYELNPDNHPSLAPAMIEAARPVCPIDPSEHIDGREARGGIIRPNLDPARRPDWPEAFFLIQNKTRLSYTLEAPSDFPLAVRTAALVAGVAAATHGLPTAQGGQAVDELGPPR